MSFWGNSGIWIRWVVKNETMLPGWSPSQAAFQERRPEYPSQFSAVSLSTANLSWCSPSMCIDGHLATQLLANLNMHHWCLVGWTSNTNATDPDGGSKCDTFSLKYASWESGFLWNKFYWSLYGTHDGSFEAYSRLLSKRLAQSMVLWRGSGTSVHNFYLSRQSLECPDRNFYYQNCDVCDEDAQAKKYMYY